MSNEKDKNVVDFSAQDASYAAKIAAVKGTKIPVGGVPMPPMPRFDQAPPDRMQGVQARPQMPSHAIIPAAQREELTRTGQMIPGVGSVYVANQPAARQQTSSQQSSEQPTGTYINPPRPEGSGLSPKTLEGLKAVAEANVSSEDSKQVDKDLEETQREIEDLSDGWMTDEFGHRVRNLLNNKQRRELIESRCEPLTIEDLITLGEVRQRVPVIPGKFEPTYRSSGGHEDIFIKKLLSNERGSEQYILDLYSLMSLAAGIFSLNGKEYPSHINKEGDPDEKLFREKLKIVGRHPLAMLADLSVNFIWFGKRVQKLFVADNIKGF